MEGAYTTDLVCPMCDRVFQREHFFLKHVTAKACQRSFTCHLCTATFAAKSNLTRHLNIVHANDGSGGGGGGSASAAVARVFLCGYCGDRFASKVAAQQHRLRHMQVLGDDLFGFQQIAHAHRKACEVLRLVYPEDVHFLAEAISYVLEPLHGLLTVKQFQLHRFKVSFILHIEFVKINEIGRASCRERV